MKHIKIFIFIIFVSLIFSCGRRKENSSVDEIFKNGEAVLESKGYTDITLFGSIPKNEARGYTHMRICFIAKDNLENIVEGYIIDDDKTINIYIEKKDTKL